MFIHNGCENLNLIAPVVTPGIFDGVHRGHRTLLSRLVARAKQFKGESVVITFSPHPRLVLGLDQNRLSLLTTLEEKTELLDKEGIDHMIILEFTTKFSRIPACDFVKDILVDKIGTRHLLLGYNHHFGSNAEGNFDTIIQCSESFDFEVEQVQGLQTEEGAISSSVIRKALSDGMLDIANKMLGYSYSLTGNVIPGRQIGRSIGFPTANIEPDDPDKLIPASGVYAVEVLIDDAVFKGMMSIGTNPTVNTDSTASSIEVYIIDFDRNIYGKRITVKFRKRLRDEIKFAGREELAMQMELDRQIAIRLLSLE
jgi:riboflavin kinase / FMN adenylyltransferase